ncbi:hypothetical protein K2Z83_22815 [Oscillochloris sp. ZM17-4]|uniref:hypothetical protein n=1 Tax=Oscillochloris sp. ZM17-4 TaxID=2866714 RepID=UPI001C7315CA|nr:hypothetical protein [Oscillochloris sp. ZM17-4]MBX0330491.1 hypothetical protein [Oscillochloris sp. ZM17-4]
MKLGDGDTLAGEEESGSPSPHSSARVLGEQAIRRLHHQQRADDFVGEQLVVDSPLRDLERRESMSFAMSQNSSGQELQIEQETVPGDVPIQPQPTELVTRFLD